MKREFDVIQNLFQKSLGRLQELDAPVRSIHIALGELAELDPQRIREHWMRLSRKTPLEHVNLVFRFVIGEAQCMACFKKYQPQNGRIHCPYCGSFGAKILSGEECYVEKIETED